MTDWELADFARAIAGDLLRKGQVPFSVSIEDLSQAGLVAALGARTRYDATRGASLRTFLGIRIRGAILDEIERQMRGYVEASYDELDAIHQAPGHMDTPERHAMHYERLMRLVKAIDRLPVRWQQLLALRYQEDLTQRQVARDMGVTEARISQIHGQITDRLRGNQCIE